MGPRLGFRLRSGLSPLLTTVPRWILFSDAQLGDNGTIPLDVLLGQVVQHLAALTDHLQQAAAAVVVVDVDLQVRRAASKGETPALTEKIPKNWEMNHLPGGPPA